MFCALAVIINRFAKHLLINNTIFLNHQSRNFKPKMHQKTFGGQDTREPAEGSTQQQAFALRVGKGEEEVWESPESIICPPMENILHAPFFLKIKCQLG